METASSAHEWASRIGAWSGLAWLREHRLALALVALTSLGAALRFMDLGGEDLWADELHTYTFSQGALGDIVARLLEDTQPPLYFLLFRAWTDVFGFSEFSGRALSLLFAIPAPLALYAVAAKLYDWRVGVVAALLLALSLYHVIFAQTIRMYAFYLLVTLVLFYAYLRLQDHHRGEGARRWHAVLVGCAAVLLYTHNYAIFTLGLLLAWEGYRALEAGGTRREHWWLVRDYALVGLLYLPWSVVPFIQLSKAVHPNWLEPTGALTLVEVFGRWAGYDRTLAVVFGVLILAGVLRLRVGGMAPSSGGRPWAALQPADGSTTLFLALWATVPVVVPFALSLAGLPFYHRYPMAAFPAALILAARGLSRLPRLASASRSIGAVARSLPMVVLVVVALLSVQGLRLYYGETNHEPWEALAAHVDATGHPGDLVLFYDRGFTEAFHFYSTKDEEYAEHWVLKGGSYDERARTEVLALARDHPRIWLIVAWNHDGLDRLEADLQATHTRGATAAYESVPVGHERPPIPLSVTAYERAAPA